MTPSGATVGRPRKNPPADAAERITALAAGGHSLVGIGEQLGASKTVLERWVKEDETLKEALDRGREKERHALHNALYTAAMAGNVVASIFLLKARHGYREGDQCDSARSSVTINLPAALPRSAFVIDHGNDPSTERLPAPPADPA